MRWPRLIGARPTLRWSIRYLTIALAVSASTAARASSADETVARGRYLATAGDCTACHTAPGGKPFAGGVAFRTAFGTIYSPNITPDAETGIGRWTDAQFLRAMHEGIGPDGRNYYPAFPYVEFSRVTTPDIMAIRAYLASLSAVRQPNRADHLPFPYALRPMLKLWNLFNFPRPTVSATAGRSPQYLRGRYLVEGLAHCGECHTPRNVLQGLASNRHLGGATIDGWTAFNITPDRVSGIGSWTAAEIARYLSTGHVEGKAQAAGPMAEAITHSLSHLRADDLAAIAAYLKAQVPVRTAGADGSRFDWGTPDPDRSSFRPAEAGEPDGRALYVANCASCHALDGGGIPARGGATSYPSLFHNGAVGAPSADNLVLAMLNGVRREGSDGPVLMPAFGPASFTTNTLSDGELAAIANYVTNRFGDPAAHTDAAMVAALRSGAVKPVLLNRLVTAGLFAVGALILALIWFGSIYLRRRSSRSDPAQAQRPGS